MEGQDVRCTTCGAFLKIESKKNIEKCDICQSTYMVEDAIELMHSKLGKLANIKNFRYNLKNAINENDYTKIKQNSQYILEVIPRDFEANYYYGYALAYLGNRHFLQKFYEYPLVGTDIAINHVIDHIITYGDSFFQKEVIKFISELKPERLEAYKNTFIKKERDPKLYTSRPKDIFICFSNRDKLIASNVADTIERHGFSSWISTRNLSPSGAANHWLETKKAIKDSKIMVVISTQSAMLSKDVQNELDTAQEYGIRILEYKIDSAEHTSFFKNIFDQFDKPSEINQDVGTINSLLYRIQKELDQNHRNKKKWKHLFAFNSHHKAALHPSNPLLKDKVSNPMKIVIPVMLSILIITAIMLFWMGSQTNLESINLSSTQVSLKIGETLKVDAEILPEDVEYNGFEWISNDSSVVTVDSLGNLRAIGVGTTIVEVNVENLKAYVEVTVDEVINEPVAPYLVSVDLIENTQIPRGISFEEALAFLDSNVTITDSIGNKEIVEISWILPANFNSDEIGNSFNVTGALTLPDGIGASEAFPANISTTITIREPIIVNVLAENITEVDVEFGTTLEGVISKLPDKVTLVDEAQTEYEVDLNWVVYNYIGDDPQWAPARYVASGLIDLPEGVSRGSIRTQVDTYVNLGVGLAHIEELKGFTVALGTSEQSILSRLDSNIIITDSVGETHNVDVVWSAPDNFDGNDYGETYLFTGIIDLPDYIGFSESMPAETSIAVTIGMTDSDD